MIFISSLSVEDSLACLFFIVWIDERVTVQAVTLWPRIISEAAIAVESVGTGSILLQNTRAEVRRYELHRIPLPRTLIVVLLQVNIMPENAILFENRPLVEYFLC